jgi:hypothetical protein
VLHVQVIELTWRSRCCCGCGAELIAGVRSGAPPRVVRDALWQHRSLVKVDGARRGVRRAAEQRAADPADLLGTTAEVRWT